jgi:hypothetical protein
VIVSAEAQTTSTDQYLAESGHFYWPDGRPAYTVKMAKGDKRRKTTVRDLRKLGLYPSVTTCLNVLDKPGLNIWMQRQIVEHGDEVTREPGESLDAYIRKILTKAKELGAAAAERGTRIHALIENHIQGKPGLIPTGGEKQIIAAADSVLQELDPEMRWLVEQSVSCKQHRYAGKIDVLNDACQIVLDWKTKEFGTEDLPNGYPEQAMQLAAYAGARGYTSPRLINAFVSVTTPGLIHLVEHDRPEKWLAAFRKLADYWWIIKGEA